MLERKGGSSLTCEAESRRCKTALSSIVSRLLKCRSLHILICCIMLPYERKVRWECNVVDSKVIHTSLKLSGKTSSSRLRSRSTADRDNLIVLVNLHDNLALLIGESLQVTLNNYRLTSLEISLSSEVSTIETLTREYLERLVCTVIRDIVSDTLIVLVIRNYLRDNTPYISLARSSLVSLNLLYSFSNSPCSSLSIQVSCWCWLSSLITIERVDIVALCELLRTLEVYKFTIYNNLIASVKFIACSELLITKCIATIYSQLSVSCSVVRDKIGSITIVGSIDLLNANDSTRNIYILIKVLTSINILQRCSNVEWVSLCTSSSSRSGRCVCVVIVVLFKCNTVWSWNILTACEDSCCHSQRHH